jgi:putative addiction module antidote
MHHACRRIAELVRGPPALDCGSTDVKLAALEEFMVRQVTVRQVGGSLGATLPKEIAERLRLAPGDRLFVTETGQGILLSPFDPEIEKQLAIAGLVAKRHRHALRELAK